MWQRSCDTLEISPEFRCILTLSRWFCLAKCDCLFPKHLGISFHFSFSYSRMREIFLLCVFETPLLVDGQLLSFILIYHLSATDLRFACFCCRSSLPFNCIPTTYLYWILSSSPFALSSVNLSFSVL